MCWLQSYLRRFFSTVHHPFFSLFLLTSAARSSTIDTTTKELCEPYRLHNMIPDCFGHEHTFLRLSVVSHSHWYPVDDFDFIDRKALFSHCAGIFISLILNIMSPWFETMDWRIAHLRCAMRSLYSDGVLFDVDDVDDFRVPFEFEGFAQSESETERFSELLEYLVTTEVVLFDHDTAEFPVLTSTTPARTRCCLSTCRSTSATSTRGVDDVVLSGVGLGCVPSTTTASTTRVLCRGALCFGARLQRLRRARARGQ